MKYLRLFENEHQYYWLVDYWVKSQRHSYMLYPDEESAKDAIITIINDERMEYESANDRECTMDMLFSDYNEAQNWYEKTFNDIEINYFLVTLKDHFEPGPTIKQLRDAKKYNL